jgi:sulfate permease, SulP family
LQVVLGFVRFGWLLNLISSPVLMGFAQAAALLIIASQLPAVLGVETGWRQWLAAPHLHTASAAFGLAILALLVLARRWRPAFPSVLFIVAGAAAVSAWTGFEGAGGKVVGSLPAGLPHFLHPPAPAHH